MQLSLSIGLAVLAIGINAQQLKKNLIQKASTVNGAQGGKLEEGTVASDTSDENFINICDGKTLTNGKQLESGSCNGIPMGDIPSKNNMVSSLITFPKTGEPVKAGQSFDIKVKVTNLVAGSFTNPLETYYAAPQKLQGGKIVGHTHVTVQNMGNTMNPQNPLAADKFDFFKGINTKADANGLLSATVTDGLPAGIYRVCTLTSAANHQGVIMPVAQRGAQDDCTKFEVTGNGGGGGGAANADKKANNAKTADANKNNTDANKNAKNADANKNNTDANKNAKTADANKNNTDANKNAKTADANKKNTDANKNNEANKATNGKADNDDDDDKDDKPKTANATKDKGTDGNKFKKSTIAEMEQTEKRPGVITEDCQKLARRAIAEKTKNTANLEGANGIKKDKPSQRRSTRVFVS